jgi:hypothetical protein
MNKVTVFHRNPDRRRPNENFSVYKVRQKKERKALDSYLRGRLWHDSFHRGTVVRVKAPDGRSAYTYLSNVGRRAR